MKTAQHGMVVIGTDGIRTVAPQAIAQWKELVVNKNVMCITEPLNFKRVNSGYVLNFKVLDQHGRQGLSNIFIGDRNEHADVQCKILRCTPQELKDPTKYQYILSRLAGRVLKYSIAGNYIRPVMTYEVTRLDHFIRRNS